MKKFKAKRKSKFKLLKIIFVIGICYFSFSYSLKLLINKKIKSPSQKAESFSQEGIRSKIFMNYD